MEREFIPYEQALALKELVFDEPCFNRFYTKPQSKMFGVDEKGRHYPIKNTSKKLYTMGEDFVLNDSNVILAPLYQQAFRWFREKYKIYIQHDAVLTGHSQGHRFMLKDSAYSSLVGTTWCETYEEAELECLKKLIEIVKAKQVPVEPTGVKTHSYDESPHTKTFRTPASDYNFNGYRK